jgi:ribosomal protein S12 methylthiotransferase accessory factor
MNQFLPAVLPSGARGAGQYRAVDGEIARWWATATVDNQPYLVPDPGAPSRGPRHWPEVANDDLAVDLDHARAIVEAIGLEMLVLDQTRPDIGLPVAKVIVPGLRHFWARFGPGRLYDVPVDLGWADRPTAEEDLNPIPVFI